MAWTYEPSSGSNLAKVRLLITDTDPARPIMTDEDITMFLGLTAGEPMIAAAMALENIAANEALCSKAVNILGLTVDGPGVAKALRATAKSLREDYEKYANSGSAGFVTIELADDYLQQQERFLKQYQRGELP
jgi:hypothetical protein